MIKQLLAVTAMAVSLQSLPASAQTTGTDVGFIGLQKPTEKLASEFMGAEVKNSSGETIGRLTNLMFAEDNRVTAAVISIGGFAGIGAKKVAVPFDILTVKPGKDGRRTITAPLSKESLQTAPIFQSLYDQEGGMAATVQRELTKWGKKATEAAKEVGEKAKEAYSDAKKSMEEKRAEEKPAQ